MYEQMLDGVNVMFNNKVKLFLVTLIFMLSISAVAAVENTTSSDDMLIGEVDEEPPSGVVQDISTDNNLEVTDNDDKSQIGTLYELKVDNVKMYYKNGSSYDVTLLENFEPVKDASVSITINGVSYTKVTDKSGKISIPITLNSGSYVATAKYSDIQIKNTIKVLPVISASDVTTTYKSTAQYKAKFLDGHGNPLKNSAVKFKVNGKTYSKKTNAKGYATFETSNLKVGSYVIQAIHPNGYKKSNKIVIKNSVVASNVKKHYLSSKKFSATFYGKNGKLLANKYVKFYRNGEYFSVKTNSKGVASIAIISKPTTFKMVSINPETGQKVSRNVTILSTLSASKVSTFSDKTATFKVKLYKDDKLVKNAKVYVYIKGVKKTAKTNADGIASVNFKLAKGNYDFVSYDPYTKYSIKTKVSVKLASIRAYTKNTYEDSETTYTATLLNQDGSLAKNTKMQMTLNGKTYNVKTNVKGVASITFKLKEGKYKIVCKDPRTDYTKTCTVNVYGPIVGIKFDKYGVSEDGSMLMVVGRPSAVGEESKYGYTFYKTLFERTCPYCGGHNLYWHIFWAGSEYADGGIFPATGRYETGSAEGNIFCKDCDCDFSIFGNEHVWSNPMHLKILDGPYKSSKEEAYALKSGNYVLS